MKLAYAAVTLQVDLPRGEITWADGRGGFGIDESRRQASIEGRDEIDLIRRHHAAAIEAFALAQAARMPGGRPFVHAK